MEQTSVYLSSLGLSHKLLSLITRYPALDKRNYNVHLWHSRREHGFDVGDGRRCSAHWGWGRSRSRSRRKVRLADLEEKNENYNRQESNDYDILALHLYLTRFFHVLGRVEKRI